MPSNFVCDPPLSARSQSVTRISMQMQCWKFWLVVLLARTLRLFC